uniref:hypothetical protein n=1 Tax=Jatropha curcas TaxID=180498 RepID=UPI00279830AF|nr:hypothetical protein QLP06_mgp016 [Jatropha curcas]WFG81223.1 hypothetical protein [Jatropha curcas]
MRDCLTIHFHSILPAFFKPYLLSFLAARPMNAIFCKPYSYLISNDMEALLTQCKETPTRSHPPMDNRKSFGFTIELSGLVHLFFITIYLSLTREVRNPNGVAQHDPENED